MKRLLIISLLAIYSCAEKEIEIEKSYITTFNKQSLVLKKVINYVQDNYYSSNNIYDGNSLNFILEDIVYVKNNVRTDKEVTYLLTDTEVNSVSFLKSSMCLDKYRYDLVRFDLKSKSKYRYYYVYRFCPIERANSYESNSFKSINLGGNWFLEIEKK